VAWWDRDRCGRWVLQSPVKASSCHRAQPGLAAKVNAHLAHAEIIAAHSSTRPAAYVYDGSYKLAPLVRLQSPQRSWRLPSEVAPPRATGIT
jgi:hypothetical protein